MHKTGIRRLKEKKEREGRETMAKIRVNRRNGRNISKSTIKRNKHKKKNERKKALRRSLSDILNSNNQHSRKDRKTSNREATQNLFLELKYIRPPPMHS